MCAHATLEKTSKEIAGVPGIPKQHHINGLHKDVIEYVLYATRKESYVFKFWDFFLDYIVTKRSSTFILSQLFEIVLLIFLFWTIFVYFFYKLSLVLCRNKFDEISAFLKRYSVTKKVIPSRRIFLPARRSYHIFWIFFFCIYSSSSRL